MQKDMHKIAIIPAKACGSSLDAGIRDQERFYLAWDQQACRLFVIQWKHIRWVCSCGTPGCSHQLAANTYVFERSQKQASQ